MLAQTVFQKMSDSQVQEKFLLRKSDSYNVSDTEFSILQDYIHSHNFLYDLERLRAGDFFFEVPERFCLRKKNSNHRRAVYRFRENENILLQLMAFVLHDFDDMYTDSVYSFRLKKHISSIFRKIRANKFSSLCWTLKADIHSYGDNVNPKKLLPQLTDLFNDDDPMLVKFFRFLLERRKFFEHGQLRTANTGALSGCALTNFFENIYLMDIDKVLISHSKFYCRYADDIAVFAETEEEIRVLCKLLQEKLSELDLTFNENKTDIVRPGERFDLLGFQIEGNNFDISENSMQKIEWKFRHYAQKLVRGQRRGELSQEEAMMKMIERINGYFFGTRRYDNELNSVDWSFPVLTRNDSLKRLDKCAQDCIRYVGSGGRNGSTKYRVRYKTMREMGYKTLVYAFYHGKGEAC